MLCSFVLVFFLPLIWAAPPTYTSVSTTCPPEPTGNLTCHGRCSGNYTQSPIDCKCYHWHQSPTDELPPKFSFNVAQIFCKSQFGSLIKITSAAQNSWLANWMYDQGAEPYPWIGLTCPGSTKDVCYWTDGSPLTCYDNFDTKDQSLQSWDGSNRNFLLVSDIEADDFGTWYRDDGSNIEAVVCMRDSQ